MKMERIKSSETSALKAQTPGDYPKDAIRHVEDVVRIKFMKVHLVGFTIQYIMMHGQYNV